MVDTTDGLFGFSLLLMLSTPLQLAFPQDEGIPLAPIETMPPEVKLLDGRPAEPGAVGSQLMVSATHEGRLDKETSYVLILEVRRSDGTTCFLGWQSSIISHQEVRTIGMVWTPDREDIHQVRVFAISGFEEPLILSPIYETTFETDDYDF